MYGSIGRKVLVTKSTLPETRIVDIATNSEQFLLRIKLWNKTTFSSRQRTPIIDKYMIMRKLNHNYCFCNIFKSHAWYISQTLDKTPFTQNKKICDLHIFFHADDFHRLRHQTYLVKMAVYWLLSFVLRTWSISSHLDQIFYFLSQLF